MKTGKPITSALLLALLLSVRSPAALAESVPLADYQRQAHGIAEKTAELDAHPERAAALLAGIPDQVTVATSSGEVAVQYKRLKDDLAVYAQADEKKRATLFPKIREYARQLDAAASAYDAPAADASSARGKLKDILARREFKKVQEPTAKDALLAKLFRWLSRLLSKVSVGKGSGFDLLKLFVYLLAGAAVVLLAAWTLRQLRLPEADLPQREIIPFSPSARSWRAWLADARSLSQQQDWRGAIHLAYWAGISYLEEHGAWKPNRARTPREYLRLVGSRAASYPELAALTRKLELVWYGYGTALESDFQETLVQLEKLGCR